MVFMDWMKRSVSSGTTWSRQPILDSNNTEEMPVKKHNKTWNEYNIHYIIQYPTNCYDYIKWAITIWVGGTEDIFYCKIQKTYSIGSIITWWQLEFQSRKQNVSLTTMWLIHKCSVFMSGSCRKDYDKRDEFACCKIYCYIKGNYKLSFFFISLVNCTNIQSSLFNNIIILTNVWELPMQPQTDWIETVFSLRKSGRGK